MIPATKRDINFLPRVIYYAGICFPNMGRFYVVVPASQRSLFQRKLENVADRTVVLAEDSLLPGLNFASVDMALKQSSKFSVNTGWYLQQFLKFAFSFTPYAGEYYLTWDSDTLPLVTLDFMKNEQPLFTLKSEYHKPYFATIKRLLGLDKCIPDSFIAEHMLFKTNVVHELIESIEQSAMPGDTWYEKIISACEFQENIGAFSEFETYGTFTVSHYPDLYGFRKLSTFRHAGLIRGRHISDKMLQVLSFDLDTASFELFDSPVFPYNLDIKWLKFCKDIRKLKEILGQTSLFQIPAVLLNKIRKRRCAKLIQDNLVRIPKSD